MCIDNLSPFCTILPRELFIDEQVTISPESIEKSIDCELENLHQTKLDFDEYLSCKQKKQARINSLLQLYLEENLSYFLSRFEAGKSIYEALDSNSDSQIKNGALFYYPQHNYCEFSSVVEFLNTSEKTAIPYIKMHDAEKEFVICVCLNKEVSICGVFSKESANKKISLSTGK